MGAFLALVFKGLCEVFGPILIELLTRPEVVSVQDADPVLESIPGTPGLDDAVRRFDGLLADQD